MLKRMYQQVNKLSGNRSTEITDDRGNSTDIFIVVGTCTGMYVYVYTRNPLTTFILHQDKYC
jgi:hypothetical protein